MPKLCDFGDDYLVLEDAGPTLNIWLNDETLSWAEKITYFTFSDRYID